MTTAPDLIALISEMHRRARLGIDQGQTATAIYREINAHARAYRAILAAAMRKPVPAESLEEVLAAIHVRRDELRPADRRAWDRHVRDWTRRLREAIGTWATWPGKVPAAR